MSGICTREIERVGSEAGILFWLHVWGIIRAMIWVLHAYDRVMGSVSLHICECVFSRVLFLGCGFLS